MSILVADFTEKPQTDEDIWWNEAKEMEARVAAGETLSAADANHLAFAVTTDWYRSRTDLERRKAELMEGLKKEPRHGDGA